MFPRRVCVDRNFYRQFLLSCNRSEVGRKGDTSGGISKLKKERRSCDKRSEGNMSGWVVGRSHRSDGEKLISRRPCRCTTPRRIGLLRARGASQQNLFGDSFRPVPASSVPIIYILSYSSHSTASYGRAYESTCLHITSPARSQARGMLLCER